MSNGEAAAQEPEVSVVVPSFNRWPLLSRALASVLAQSGVNFEVLVVDDFSSDETPERLAAVEDPRLRVIRQESNMGVARARNRGIELARGAWVAFLDDDDFWAPTRLEEHLRAIEAAGASWGYGASLDFDGVPRRTMLPADPDDLGEALLQANVAGAPSSATVRRDLLNAVGGFDENLNSLADWDLWIRLNARAPGALCPIPLVAYCHHTTNMLSVHRSRIPEEVEYMARKHARLMPPGERFGALTIERFETDQDRLDGRPYRAAIRHLRMGVRERSRIDLLRGIGLLFGKRMVRALQAMGTPDAPSPPLVWSGVRASVYEPSPAADSARRPAVSVVVPTRDRWSLLEVTLTSVLAQRDVDLEVVVVDDGSSTAPPPLPALEDERVRLVRSSGPHGVAHARNLGIDQARGEWIAFLDDDDVWAPDKLRLQVHAAASRGASFAYAAVALVTG
ncbi:MAG TPA: glycosyltransferase family 2 protein, partial [Solirubrobacterales bacterium]|nr:glycosyltransferase family 2 protein [Solirubrobacterales bacterium]